MTCARGAVLGLLLGVLGVAQAQEPTPTDGDTIPPWALDLARALGLPAALTVAGWRAGRTAERLQVTGLPVVVRLHAEDRELLTRVARASATARAARKNDGGT